jgi:hypothetical protein
MNGWNEFQYNFASSAGTCGVCYWLLPGGISGPSQYEYSRAMPDNKWYSQTLPTPINLLSTAPA